jgi:hypothetical protein
MPVFSPLSPARAQDFARTIAGMIAGRVSWQTPVEFRAWVCLTHELTHYLQDLTTGVGHWDHVARERRSAELLGRARCHSGPRATLPVGSVRASDVKTHALESETLDLVGRLRAELLFVQSAATPSERQSAPKSRAAPLLVPRACLSSYAIEALLEGDAAAVALRQVINIDAATREQWEIMKDNVGVWLPDAMPDEYAALLNDAIALAQHLWGDGYEELRGQERDAFLTLSAKMLGFLVDVACAHPSAELLTRQDADATDYEPGLRYVRMAAAIGAMNEGEVAAFFDAMRVDAERAEALLVERSGHAYLPSRSVYEDWAERFEAMSAADPGARIAQLRAHCCRIRLDRPDAWTDKSLWSVLEHELPFYVLGPDGLTSLGQQWAHLDPGEAAVIYNDLMWNGVKLGLHDLFFETGRFVCPLARARTCDAATDACSRGLRRTSAFPPSPGCQVRQGLEGQGFDLGGAS